VPIVRLLFEYGRFDPTATERTALAFLIYAPQLPFVALDQLLVFAFYARQQTLAPNLMAIVALAVYVIVALPARAAWGMEGLVLANTAQNVAHALAMLALLRWQLGGLPGAKLGRPLLVMLLGALAVYASAGLVASALETSATTLPGRLVQVGAGISAGTLAYAAVLGFLRLDEAQAAWRWLTSRAHGR
jgi:putative peptidoglycan lipid II flippase